MNKKILMCIFAMACLGTFPCDLSAKGIKEKVADSYYERLAYKKAIPYFEELANSKKANADILRKTADSYNKIGDTENALKWYKELYDKKWANTDDKYEYLLVLRKANKYDESLVILKDYLGEGGKAEFAQFLAKNPNYIQKLEADSKENRFKVQDLPFNTDEHDFGASFYEKGIVFASPEMADRVSLNRKFAWDNTRFLQIYYVEPLEDGKYSDPKLFKITSRTKYHDGPISFNKDFTEAFLTRSNYSASGKLSKDEQGTVQVSLYTTSKNEDGSWSELKPFPYNSKDYSLGCATLSKDGNILVFASDMPGGKGLSDLWMCKKEANGEWGTPVHLGDKINTERRDNFPFLDDEGNLYFSSDGGLYGLGGYDVFWVPGFLSGNDKVYNLGTPINSEADDFGYIYDTKTAKGYFNSGRAGVKGDENRDDIFSFERFISLVSIQILDKETRKPIANAVGCVKTKNGDNVASNLPLDTKGTFSKELLPASYVFCGEAEGYETGELALVVPQGKFVTGQLFLEKKKEEVVVAEPCPEVTLDEIYYDFDKYVIRDNASVALDELASFLKEHPEATIVLTSHTDSRGTAKYNDWLSKKRAESAVNYLVEKGIARERMTAVGAGESQLVNDCRDGVPCTERQHQANRRTTVQINMEGCLEVHMKPNKYLED